MSDEDQKQEVAGESTAQPSEQPAEAKSEKPSEDTKEKATIAQEEAPKNDKVEAEKKEGSTEETNGGGDAKNDDNDNDNDARSPYQKRKDRTHDDRDDRNGRNGRKPFQKKQFNKPNRNIKTRFEDLPESKDEAEIRNQVEFYFSDSNLPVDAYLLGLSGGSENKPVDLKVIHNFKRMRHFQPFSAVRDAVKASKFLNLDDDDQITRKVPLDSKFTDDATQNRSLVHTASMSRSIYAKGFGEEKESTHLDIESFFAPYGPTKAVRLRRHDDGEFKGSVFVEFESEDLQQKFLELDPKPEFEDKQLQISSKQEYVDTKHQGIIDGSVKPKGARGRGGHRGGRGRGGNKHNHRDRDGSRERNGSGDKADRDDWNSRRDHDQRNDRRGGRGGRGRGRGRGGRGGGRREDQRRSRSPDEIEKPARGNKGKDEGENKKRGREDEGEERQGPEAKKAKEDVVAGDA